jgi:hypothetical protein
VHRESGRVHRSCLATCPPANGRSPPSPLQEAVGPAALLIGRRCGVTNSWFARPFRCVQPIVVRPCEPACLRVSCGTCLCACVPACLPRGTRDGPWESTPAGANQPRDGLARSILHGTTYTFHNFATPIPSVSGPDRLSQQQRSASTTVRRQCPWANCKDRTETC